MPAHVIINRGRVGDRAPFMIRGAEVTGAALASRLSAQTTIVGVPEPAANDDWTESLPAAADTLSELGCTLDAVMSRGDLPFVLSSTCSASLATLPVVHRHHPEVAVLYIDGHADFNTPQTGSGYLGGMVLSGACGLWETGYNGTLPVGQAAVIGSRDIDPGEANLMSEHGLRHLPPAAATPRAVREVIGERPVWIHVDWDVLDPGHIPADYVVPDGILPDQLRDIFAAIPPAQLCGVELAEFNAPEDSATAQSALEVLLGIVEPLTAAAA
ncbi:arginase family protein [Janibacter sp. FSL W8-0316]|uniref:arginase family protein n=1 Tax=Janibacter sp. FSL W8-0316 TaxID=2975325 RepID=UPI0030FB2877